MKLTLTGNTLFLAGHVDLTALMQDYETGLKLIRSHRELIIDLKAVESQNTAVLTLLLAWLGEAQRRHQKIYFRHIPEFLFLISRVYGVEKILLMDNR